jgi:hypothetical protein
MRKAMMWLFVITLIVFVIDWGVVGVKLLDGDYDITTGAYIGYVCWIVMIVCCLYRIFSRKCPHCGKLRTTGGSYCPYCGRKID